MGTFFSREGFIHCSPMGLMERQDTSISVPRPVFKQLRQKKPSGASWGDFLSKELGLTDDTLTRSEVEEAVGAVAQVVEDAGVASADEFSGAVKERLEVDA